MNWFSFLTYAAITAFTPGPNNIMSMTNGSQKGFKKALPFNLGILLGVTAAMLLCTAFIAMLSALIPKIRLPMLLAGAAYMLYLAWGIFRSRGDIGEGGNRKGAGFLSGVLLQFINPKLYIYCIVSMEAYILPHYGGRPPYMYGLAVFLGFLGFVSTLCWSAFGSVFRRIFATGSRTINAVMALLLVYCAVSLFL